MLWNAPDYQAATCFRANPKSRRAIGRRRFTNNAVNMPAVMDKYPATMIIEQFMSHPQFELQAIVARGWLLTKAAEPATSKPSTTAKARIFNCRPRYRRLNRCAYRGRQPGRK
jgi:hypothetical protein